VAIYPFAKRFTWWPQVFLGIAFNWGALLGWTAHSGSLGWPAVILYLAGMAWTLFYDTIYAHQDKEDDALIGVKSTARLFGDDRTPAWLARFLVATVALMGLAVVLAAPRGDGYGSSDGVIRSEFSTLKYGTGYVGMASAGKDTEGSQWFITHSPTPHLDGAYTIFGRVTKGMEVVNTIEVGDQIKAIVLP